MLRGEGSFVDDLAMPGTAHMVVIRSPFAHATIRGVDVAAARSMPGVIAVFSGQDLAGDWAGPLLMAWPVTALGMSKSITGAPTTDEGKTFAQRSVDAIADVAKENGQTIDPNSIVPGYIWGPALERYFASLAKQRGSTPKQVYDEVAARTALT